MTLDTPNTAAARACRMVQRLGAGEGRGIVFVVVVLAVLMLCLTFDFT
jgi:hypothetical protein